MSFSSSSGVAQQVDVGSGIEGSGDTNTLRQTMDYIRDVCEFSRVLVLGRSGVGKSSLINSIFKIDGANETGPDSSHLTPGVADINKEFTSDQNPDLRFHDSMGYEAGETSNFNILKDFITQHSGEHVSPKDRIHVVWLCVATPTNGSRLIQSGDSEIFKLCTKCQVPIVVVFTRYDLLVNAKEFEHREKNPDTSLADMESVGKDVATAAFRKDCALLIRRAEKYNAPYVNVSVNAGYESSVKKLVEITLQCINPSQPTNVQTGKRPRSSLRQFLGRISNKPTEIEGTSSRNIPEAMATMLASTQRVDGSSKIEYCIIVGQKKYWRGLLSGINFFGKGLDKCLFVLHTDMVTFWNLKEDAPHYLRSRDFIGEMTRLVEDLVDPKTSSPNSGIISNITKVAGAVTTVAGIAVGAANPAAFITLPVIASVVIALWVYEVYQATPPIVRCFMAYIVDLVIILHMVFMTGQPVQMANVTDTIQKYKDEKRNQVHHDIRMFVENSGTWKMVTEKDKVFIEMTRLIHDNIGSPSEAR